MEVEKECKTPYHLKDIRGRINEQPLYQRQAVWNAKKKSKLIDSILRGFDIPKFYITPGQGDVEFEVVDGQQRMTAIWDFMEGKFTISGDFDRWGKLSEVSYQDLSSDLREYFGQFKLDFVILKEVKDGEVEELFVRLQEGVQANSAEKRNAVLGGMRNFVANLSTRDKLFDLSRIDQARYKWHDYTAHVVRLELENGPTEISGNALTEMYEKKKQFSENSSKAKKVRRVFNYLRKGVKAKIKKDIESRRVKKGSLPELKLKWPFVDLYWLTSCFLDEYSLSGHELDMIEFYVGFEGLRTNNRSKKEELAASGEFWDTQLYRYIDAFLEGNTRRKVQQRHEVYRLFALKYFDENNIDLRPKDPKRDFTPEERLVIWRRDNETCQLCNKKISFEDMEADHREAHSIGGPTVLSNGQCLCSDCNKRKRDKPI